jgi:hypothetical protein
MCLLSATIGVAIRGSDINIFTQIGFVVLVGLASKNAVLIVEFAKHKLEAGLSIREATLAACQLRLRPILMTSFAFILGVLPLVTAAGAGKEMRQALGVAVFSGMLGVTLFGIFLTPVFFFVIEWLANSWLFASTAIRRIGAVLLGIFTLGYVWTAVRWAWRRRRGALKPANTLERELADVDRFFGERSKHERSSHGDERPSPNEKMVVVDHQRGKTDIIVVQQIATAGSNDAHGATEHVAAVPFVAELVEPPGGGGTASVNRDRDESK